MNHVYRFDWGPSPRARGAETECPSAVRTSGTIPACAGSRRALLGGCWQSRDHPRVRGEQPDRVARCLPNPGPSPRARGADRPRRRDGRQRRTIPACAGSSHSSGPRKSLPWDHPRVRGEQAFHALGVMPSAGPSPRARGAAGRLAVGLGWRGTIPACAGSRPPARGRARTSWDHPRVRGEQIPVDGGYAINTGPSPRARGADRHAGPLRDQKGTIPACAGSSAGGSGGRGLGWDHPRVRGEQDPPVRVRGGGVGPSPRARGAADRRADMPTAPGTIPACAGSSSSRR